MVRIGETWMRLGEVDSTNEQCFRWLQGGDPRGAHGTVVTARAQTAGRGRLGRSWSMPPSTGVLLSVILDPLPLEVQTFCVLGAIAVEETVRELTSLSPQLKWPNDVLLNGLKLAGILAESRTSLRGSSGTPVVLGMGLNVLTTSRQLKDKGLAHATSLAAQADVVPTVQEVEQGLVSVIDREYTRLRDLGKGPLFERWRDGLGLVGRSLEITCGRETIRGTLEALNDDWSFTMIDAHSRRSTIRGEFIVSLRSLDAEGS